MSAITYSETIVMVPPEKLFANPHNPRTSGPGDVTELMRSIMSEGVLEPLLVRAHPTRGHGCYILDAGERRWTAAKHIPVDLPCRVGVLDTGVSVIEHTLITGLTENGPRANLNAIERAHAYKKLMAECGLTQTQLAERLGLTGGTISRTLKLLVLSERTQQAVVNKQLTVAQAHQLVTQHNEKQRKKAGQASQVQDYEPPIFVASHFLAGAARRLCDSSEHNGNRVLRGGVACERHWERAIRLDEAKVQQVSAREAGFNVPFSSPEMAAAGNQLGNGAASERR